ncbi:MAG TPA: glycosyltransferase family 4 protein [Isosphaeraceae bacterium]|nr:glycosyltransferase family 4 protein [Isosphaeraceae bacterium]
MKIAWFTPFRPGGSGIAHYSAAACSALRADGHDVVVFASDWDGVRPNVRDDLPAVVLDGPGRAAVLRDLPAFDLVVYNLGDNVDYHKAIYEFSREYPGLVMLHDLVMRNFFVGYYLRERGGDLAGLLRLMEYCHGAPGAAWMEAAEAGRIADVWSDPHVLEYHMARAAVAAARGVVVHSEFCRARLAEVAGSPVARVAFPAPPLAGAALAWEPPPAHGGGRPVDVLTFGCVNPNKCVDLVIRCLGSSPALRGRVAYTVVGAVGEAYRDRLARLAAECGVAGAVRLLGHRADEALHEAIRAADVVVNLRNPHFGESSWSLAESLFAARPTIVWDHGSYAELPDGAVRKVSGPEGLTAALEDLCGDAGRRRAQGEAARRHALEAYDPRRYARDLLEFAGSLRGHDPVLGLTDRAARIIREMGAGPGTRAVVDRVAEEIGRLADDGPAPDPFGRRAGPERAAARGGRAA